MSTSQALTFMIHYGLIGRSLAHSFSASYFSKKFSELNLQDSFYQNFELSRVAEFLALLSKVPELRGLNVTIPYKEAIIPFLDQLSPEAKAIGAVNTIAFTSEGLVGHNTDSIGFLATLEPYLHLLNRTVPALIFGTGGASKAVRYVLEQLAIPFHLVSRNAVGKQYSYSEAADIDFDVPRLLVNTTPIGMYPNEGATVDFPWESLAPHHVVIDLIYNPLETEMLRRARLRGAHTENGHKMLVEQAEAAWTIWQNTSN